MKIYKKLSSDFTVLSNEIFRHDLSLKAIGLYVYLINKPESWTFSIAGTSVQLKEGKDSIRVAVHELEKAGFLERKQNKLDNKFAPSDWYIHDKPLTDLPLAENPTAGIPMTENPTQVNTKEVSINKVSTSSNEEEGLSKDVPVPVEQSPNYKSLITDALEEKRRSVLFSEEQARLERIAKHELKACTQHFKDKFKARFKKAYTYSYGKDDAIMKRLFKVHGKDQLIILIDRYFGTPVEFRKAGTTIQLFAGSINNLISTGYGGQFPSR